MSQDRFLIAPYDKNSGLQDDVRPWLLPEQAFAELTNAFVFRGRVRKRIGSRWMGNNQLLSRLRINIATTDGVGDTPAGTFVPRTAALVPIATPAIGQLFSIGNEVFTVVALGNPAAMLISAAATLATFDTTTGQVIITGAAPNTTVYYYPSLPVMGLQTYENSATNNEMLIAFDTRFAYEYNNGFERLSNEITPGAAAWTGSDSQFFWTSTWSGVNASDRVFFVTNFNQLEPNFMRTFFNNQWDNFRPQVSAIAVGPPATIDIFLESARILVPFKNRLVAFNTWELEDDGVNPPNLINYVNRARYSQVGSPLDANAWRQDIEGRGSGIDAPTMEAITTIEFIKDRLIVFFERSTWEFVYTGNQAYPFAWQQINTELGAESTFSIVPFDKVAVGIGNVGVHACNGSNVERIDEKIPNLVFDIHNDNAGVERVYGIRDYFVEAVYWAYPNTPRDGTFFFPNKVLVYNYRNLTWATFEDSITAFGYFQPQQGVTWDSTTITWNDAISWDSGALQAQFRQVIAGNQEGYVFIFDSNVTTNASVIQITQITVVANVVTITAINHNFRNAQYIYIEGVTSTGNLTLLNNKIFDISLINPITANTFSFVYNDGINILVGMYSGGGVISRVSNITITTKQYNFYTQQGRNASISKVDCMVTTTAAGQIDVNYYVSTSSTNMLGASLPTPLGTGSLLGTGALDTFAYPLIPLEATSDRVWHPIYIQADGEVIQLQFNMNDVQMKNTDIRTCDFQLHALVIHAQSTSARLQ